MQFLSWHQIFLVYLLSSIIIFANAQDEAILIKTLDTTSGDLQKVSLLNDLAESVIYSNPNKALEYLHQAIPIYKYNNGKEFDEQFAINCNKNGIIFTMQNDFVKALEFYHKAILLTEKLAVEYPENRSVCENDLAVLYANIGTIYYHQDNIVYTIQSWKKAEKYFSRDSLSENLAVILSNLGAAYSEDNNIDSSLIYHKKALYQAKKIDAEKLVAICYTNIGEVYASKGLYNNALDYYTKSIKIKEKINDRHGLVYAYLALAELYFDMKQFDKSIGYAEKVLNISSESKYLKASRDANKLLSDCYKQSGDFKRSLNYFTIYKNLNDSIFNKESDERFIEIEAKYKTVEKENELRLMKQKERNELLVKRILIFSLVFAIIVFAMVIYLVIIKRKKDRSVFKIVNKLKDKENHLIKSELEKSRLAERELNTLIEYKSKQLTTHALHMMQKNEMLANIIQMSNELLKLPEQEIKTKIRSLRQKVKQSLKTENDWEIFKLHFEEVNNDFFKNLLSISPELNSYDLRHSALIKLNLNIKESASVLNLSPHTVKSARYRLKKKLHLSPDDDMNEFLRNI